MCIYLYGSLSIGVSPDLRAKKEERVLMSMELDCILEAK